MNDIDLKNNVDTNNGNILKELSDIKSSLAVNTNETQNIKNSVNEIKTDIKEIKSDFVSRREMKDAIETVKDEIIPLRKIVYGAVSFILLAVLSAVVYTVITHH